MDLKYTLNIYDLKDYEKAIKALNKLSDIFQSKELLDYLGNKCLDEVKKITDEKLKSGEDYIPSTEYRSNHKMDISGGTITISNETMADLSNLKEETLANYSEGLSLSKLIEFGTGIPRNR